MSTYPSISDYIDAVLDQERAFRTPALRRATFVTDDRWGSPRPMSGTAAVVFRASVNGVDQALRFFIQEDVSERRRYAALGSHFAVHGLRDCVAATSWVDDAIQVGGRPWPMIQMEWVEGRTFDSYVGHLVDRSDKEALQRLAVLWRGHVARLQNAGFAHGDLQHGNVLVDTSRALRLVDIDGSWIEAFESWPPPRESGHLNYQRPGRIWGRWMDTFPALVIYTGLLALARRPDAWRPLYTGDNMLFTRDDFVDRSTRVWTLLREIKDPEVEHALGRLRSCCALGWSASGSLESLLDRPVIDIPAQRIPKFTGVSGTAPTVWYRDPVMPSPPVKIDQLADTRERPAFVGVRGSGGFFGQHPEAPSAARPIQPAVPAPNPAPVPPPNRPPTLPSRPVPASSAAGVALVVAVIVVLIVLALLVSV